MESLSNNNSIKLSVVIPVKNGASTLHKCLQSIATQKFKGGIEIIILDSMSSDESRKIALQYGARIIDIPGDTFDHGLTRNIGAQRALGECIFYTVQDAWIEKEDMLSKMYAHFQDEDIKAVCGHQAVPHDKDKNPVLWYRPYSKPEVTVRKVDDAAAFKKLSAAKQQELIAWDDVVAMYRKTALMQQPFIKTSFAEDWIWSRDALMLGWKLLYDPGLVVYHYHHMDYRYTFRLHYTLNYHFYKYFKYTPRLPLLMMPLVKKIFHLMKNSNLSLREKLYWVMHNTGATLGNEFSVLNFLVRLKLGGSNLLEKGYKKYCTIIPQGMQKRDNL